jgi:hypothetical protein
MSSSLDLAHSFLTNPISSRKFKCRICEKQFETSFYLQNHFRKRHSDELDQFVSIFSSNDSSSNSRAQAYLHTLSSSEGLAPSSLPTASPSLSVSTSSSSSTSKSAVSSLSKLLPGLFPSRPAPSTPRVSTPTSTSTVAPSQSVATSSLPRRDLSQETGPSHDLEREKDRRDYRGRERDDKDNDSFRDRPQYRGRESDRMRFDKDHLRDRERERDRDHWRPRERDGGERERDHWHRDRYSRYSHSRSRSPRRHHPYGTSHSSHSHSSGLDEFGREIPMVSDTPMRTSYTLEEDEEEALLRRKRERSRSRTRSRSRSHSPSNNMAPLLDIKQAAHLNDVPLLNSDSISRPLFPLQTQLPPSVVAFRYSYQIPRNQPKRLFNDPDAPPADFSALSLSYGEFDSPLTEAKKRGQELEVDEDSYLYFLLKAHLESKEYNESFTNSAPQLTEAEVTM